ncbi:MAG: magnesium transporter [Rhodothalassiaceae bacterium]
MADAELQTETPEQEVPAGDAHRSPDFIHQLEEAIRSDDRDALLGLIAPLRPEDLADIFETLSSPDRRGLVRLASDTLDPAFLIELDGAVFREVAGELPTEQIAEAVEQLDSDDAVYIMEGLDEQSQQTVLRQIASVDRAAIEEGLAYPEDSAGRLMQRDLVVVPQFWTVGQTIDFMRAQKAKLPKEFYEIIVTDPFFRPLGTVPLASVMRSKRKVSMQELIDPDLHLILVTADQEEVAYTFNKYHLISAPVVNAEGRLVGVITVDDIVTVIEEEAQEDILALAGVSEGVHEGVWSTTRTRFWWLLVNLGTAILASFVIGLFDATIEAFVALAVLMPIVASMGGNAGTQTMTVAVRAIATRELSPANAMRIVNKELIVSLFNGIALALVIGVVAMLWFGNFLLGLVLAVAMVVNMVIAGLSGILVPMILDRLKVDPAVASSVFVTTITDVVGFLAFLGLAALILI